MAAPTISVLGRKLHALASIPEAAEVVGVSRAQACQIVSRSLKELRKRVESLG